MLTLFDDVFSPYARKVRIALYEKGVPFDGEPHLVNRTETSELWMAFGSRATTLAFLR
jgi:glutathione S-transferase